MKDLRKIRKLFDISKPVQMGKKLLVLATAPDTGLYFEKESVRKQFEGYDVAFLNKMILCSQEEVFLYKPRYFIFMDGVFFEDDYDGPGKGNERKRKVEEVLEKITWECYVVCPTLASFNVSNPNIRYIKTGIFSLRYKPSAKWLYRRNIANPGFNTVVLGAIYYGITFGYKNIAIMGFSYRPGYIYMDTDGLHVDDYMHYYDTEKHSTLIPFEEISRSGESFLLKRAKRAVLANLVLRDLAEYAKDMGTEVINYSPENMVDVFRAGKLSV